MRRFIFPFRSWLLLSLLYVVLVVPLSVARDAATVTRVVDGDTLKITRKIEVSTLCATPSTRFDSLSLSKPRSLVTLANTADVVSNERQDSIDMPSLVASRKIGGTTNTPASLRDHR
jgi:hypothetical protein